MLVGLGHSISADCGLEDTSPLAASGPKVGAEGATTPVNIAPIGAIDSLSSSLGHLCLGCSGSTGPWDPEVLVVGVPVSQPEAFEHAGTIV